MLVQTFTLNIQEAEEDGSISICYSTILSSKPVPGQLELHRETLIQITKQTQQKMVRDEYLLSMHIALTSALHILLLLSPLPPLSLPLSLINTHPKDSDKKKCEKTEAKFDDTEIVLKFV